MDDPETPIGLVDRPGLPEPYRAFVAELPRAGWSDHPNFDGMTAFWLERHAMLRDLLRRIAALVEAGRTGESAPDAFRRDLGRFGGLFVNQLHEHHMVEDAHYFPAFRAHEPAAGAALDLLDRDHRDLGETLQQFIDATNDLLRADAPTGELGPYAERIAAFDALLTRHLFDEEEIVIPLLLEHGGG